MRAVTFGGPNIMNLKEYQTPEPQPGWVRMKVSAVGICGSDIHLLHATNFNNEGMRPGHEMAGIIDAVGDGVHLSSGELISVEPLMGCSTCFSCSTGHLNRCSDFRIFGVHEAGAMADFINVPAELAFTLPANMDHEVAALCEPMAVVCRGVRIGKIQLGSRVAVLGAGTLGLLSILAAKASGATEIYATARYPKQKELAQLYGATQVFNSGDELLSAVGDKHIDVTLETVGGHANTLEEACKLTRPGGDIVIMGIYDGHAGLPGFLFATRELSMHGSSCYAHDNTETDFAVGTRLVAAHRDVLGHMITHRFSLDQADQAFAAAADKTSGSIKVALIPTL